MLASEDVLKAVHEAKLRYITDEAPGFRREKSGKNFRYIDVHREVIKDEKILDRINKLVVPPAWKDVWISASPNTHLQATGIDEKGRKQYIYHPEWIKITQENKFSKMVDFGEYLPKIRRRIRDHLDMSGLVRQRVLATVIWLLENTFIRIGNEEYAKENKSFGLTTLRNRHVHVMGSKVRFEFRGKSGVAHLVDVTNPMVAKTIKSCIELPGYQLFQCVDEDGKKHYIDSEDVNEYLHEITGENISAKDFRTWGGTLISATTLKKLGEFENETQAKKNITDAVKTVSSHLRNTPAVCRSYYIHPTVINTYETNILIPHFEKKSTKKINGLSNDELKLLTLLQKYS